MNDSIRLTGMSGLEIRALTTDELMGLTPLQVSGILLEKEKGRKFSR